MKRLIVKTTDLSCNIKADKLIERNNTLLAYDGEELVGAFYLGTLESAYISEQKENGRNNA